MPLPVIGTGSADSDSKNFRPVAASLLRVVKNDAQRVARAAMHTADPMTQIDAVVSARAFDRPVPRRENDRLSAIGDNHLGLGLRARLLLDEHQLSAFPIAPLLAKQKYHSPRQTALAMAIQIHTAETTALG